MPAGPLPAPAPVNIDEFEVVIDRTRQRSPAEAAAAAAAAEAVEAAARTTWRAALDSGDSSGEEGGARRDTGGPPRLCVLDPTETPLALLPFDGRPFSEVDARVEERLRFDQLRRGGFEALTEPFKGGAVDQRFTVAGMLTYVGRREVMNGAANGRRYEYRWLRVRDQGGDFVVQFFANARCEFYVNMTAGDTVALTKLAVCAEMHTSTGPTSMCLRSTACTDGYRNEQIARSIPRLAAALEAEPPLAPPLEVVLLPKPEAPAKAAGSSSTNISTSRAGRGASTYSSAVPHVVDWCMQRNASQEAVCAGDQAPEISVSLQQGRNMAALARRFPPFYNASLAELLKARFALVIAETRSFRVTACIRRAELVQDASTGLWELAVTLCDPTDKDSRLLAACRRDPIVAPVPTLEAIRDRTLAKNYFSMKVRGAVSDDAGLQHRTAQGKDNMSPQRFWIDLHRKAYDRCDVLIRAAFSATSG